VEGGGGDGGGGDGGGGGGATTIGAMTPIATWTACETAATGTPKRAERLDVGWVNKSLAAASTAATVSMAVLESSGTARLATAFTLADERRSVRKQPGSLQFRECRSWFAKAACSSAAKSVTSPDSVRLISTTVDTRCTIATPPGRGEKGGYEGRGEKGGYEGSGDGEGGRDDGDADAVGDDGA